jgi:DNA-binding MarR family transcriptional regulator
VGTISVEAWPVLGGVRKPSRQSTNEQRSTSKAGAPVHDMVERDAGDHGARRPSDADGSRVWTGLAIAMELFTRQVGSSLGVNATGRMIMLQCWVAPGIHVRELSRRLGIGHSATSSAVRTLIELGMLEKADGQSTNVVALRVTASAMESVDGILRDVQEGSTRGLSFVRDPAPEIEAMLLSISRYLRESTIRLRASRPQQ